MKYSIIIPHYNRPDLIVKTIESFRDLKDKEILIIDDVSTEENLEKLKKNIRNFENIKLFESKQKLFSAGCRNKGINKASGQWIFIIDDDDEVTLKFVRWLNQAELNENIIYRFPYINRTNKKDYKNFRWFYKNLLYSCQVSTVLISKKTYISKNIKFNEKAILNYDDTCFFNDVFASNTKTKYMNRLFSIIFNNINNNSITRAKTESIQKSINNIWLLNKTKWHKTFSLLILYHCEGRILKGHFEKDLESKKIFIETFDKLNIKLKDIWRLDWFRLFYWPTFKRNLKKWRKEVEVNK